MQEILEFFKHIIDPNWILAQPFAFWLLLFVIFAETGLFIGFFLPGDSLLFITGLHLAEYPMNVFNNVEIGVAAVTITVIIAGILGNTVGYWFGLKAGPSLFKKKDTFFFKQKHLHAAKEFYEKRGAGMIVLARFLPIIRTFAPIVAGIVQMDSKKFVFYNILGCIGWVASMVLGGYFLGQAFPWLRNHLELIVIGLVVITTTPVIIGYLKTRTKVNSGTGAEV
ncbi:VTT domain-containing protein [Solitalea sp. MAHUQ-68]|uniref:VTT domain-containing protein n=1 Tax=Solitalea agri TaxID=2953739 RepID=A0A9X2F5P3_9SPHI|nr:VTT domain-containing protein [Solitalea agri]MCO4291283.1 VTT domain-containing protein [Solitalea agri]